ALRVQLVFLDRPTRRLRGAEGQQLTRVVPFVDRLGGVDSLVALQADQLAAGPTGQHPGQLGLADAGLTLEEQWPLEPQGEKYRGGEAFVREVVVRGERVTHVVDRPDRLHVLQRIRGAAQG